MDRESGCDEMAGALGGEFALRLACSALLDERSSAQYPRRLIIGHR